MRGEGLLMGHRGRTRRGFTLIELLVVVAIIAVLAAVLFPVFTKVRDEARKARCRSNIHQIVTCIRMYLDDYDGRMPPYDPHRVGDKDYSDHNFAYAMWFFEPYYKDQGIWFCPSGQREIPKPYHDYGLLPDRHEWTDPETSRRYFTNYELGFDIGRGNTLAKHNVYEDYGPHERVQLVMDFPCNYGATYDRGHWEKYVKGMYRSHKDGCVVGCLDGHLEFWQDEWRYNWFIGH